MLQSECGGNERQLVRQRTVDKMLADYRGVCRLSEIEKMDMSGIFDDTNQVWAIDQDYDRRALEHFVKSLSNTLGDGDVQGYLEAVANFRDYGIDYDIPQVFAHKDWFSLIEKMGKHLTIYEISLLTAPFNCRPSENTRREAQIEIINAIHVNKIPTYGGFPKGINSYDELEIASEETLLNLVVYFGVFVEAIQNGLIPDKYRRQAQLWAGYSNKNRLKIANQQPAAESKTETPKQRDERWNQELIRLWLTGKYKDKLDVCKKISADEGGAHGEKYISDQTRTTSAELKKMKNAETLKKS